MKQLLGELKTTTEEWMERNDKLIDKHERGFKNIENAMSRMERLSLGGGGGPLPGMSDEEKKDFNAYMRHGVIRASINRTNDDEGGFGVPDSIDKRIGELMAEQEAMRSVSNVLVSGPNYVKLVSVGGTGAAWVGEMDARPELAAPKLAALAPPEGELYANPAATQRALDDIFFNVEEWISREVAREFAKAENVAFTSGDGVNKPKGILAGATSTDPDGTRAFGTIQVIHSGVAATFATATASVSPADVLFDTISQLKAGYRANARWMMNRATLAILNKWKDVVDGRFIFQPSLIAGMPATLAGFPVTENEDMDSVGAGTIPILFGDFRQAYYIIDRPFGTRIIRDDVTNKPFVHFYTTRRTSGMLVLDEAVKGIKISA